MNQLLETISTQATADLAALIKESSDDILAAIHKAESECEAQEAPMKFNIGFKICLDMDKRVVTNTLSWSVKQSLEASHVLDDPNQEKLGLDETTVTISSPGHTKVNLKPKHLKKLAKKFGGK